MKKSITVALLVIVGCIAAMGAGDYHINSVFGKGDGDATRKLQKIIKEEVLSGRCSGITLTAAWSSHLFWLKMGFIPIDNENPDELQKYYYAPEGGKVLLEWKTVSATVELQLIRDGIRKTDLNQEEIKNLRRFIRKYGKYLDITDDEFGKIKEKKTQEKIAAAGRQVLEEWKIAAAVELELIIGGIRRTDLNKEEIKNLGQFIHKYGKYLDITDDEFGKIEKHNDFYKEKKIQEKVSAFLAGVPEIDIFAVELTQAINESLLKGNVKSSKDIPTWDIGGPSCFIPMRMSPEGLERWKTAIKEDKEFVPFRDLKPLRDRIRSSVIRKELEEAMAKCPVGVFNSKT